MTDAEKLEEKKVIKMVDDDAWKDFRKEQTEEVQQLAQKIIGKVKPQMIEAIRQIYKELIAA